MWKQWLVAGALAGTGLAQAFTPQTGTWVVTSELNGKPGRGLAIDVQDKTLALQMYAYEANGSATFYQTSGPLVDNQYTGTLNKYRGGRYLGSGDRTGVDNGNEGVVKMRFESGTKGYVTFPGEPEKEISRFQFAYGPNAQSLVGLWLLTPLTSATPQSDFVTLDTYLGASDSGTGMVGTRDGRFGCDNLVRGHNAGWVLCVKLNQANQLARSYFFKYMVNDGEGLTGKNSEPAGDLLIVRRLTDDRGDGLGIMFKSAEDQGSDEAVDPTVLRQVLEQTAAQVATD